MGNCFNGLAKKDIISEKSLAAVRNVVEYLKEDVIQRDIFRATGYDIGAQQIARELSKGGPNLFKLLEDSTVRDIAGGLIAFLMELKKPIIPPTIQAIVLDPDNKSVCPEVVAQDVLGLIKQEVDGRQFKLLQYTFDLLHHILKYTPTDELTGSNVPIYMMPIFFNMQAEHILHWRRVAIIFVEIIRLAPQQLNITQQLAEDNGNSLIVRNVSSSMFAGYLQQQVNDLGLVLRKYLVQTGNRGDCKCLEVYTRSRKSKRQRHRL